MQLCLFGIHLDRLVRSTRNESCSRLVESRTEHTLLSAS